MAVQVSPGIAITEFNFSQVVPAVSASIGAAAGVFKWGPVRQLTFISNEAQLVSTFGEPSNFNPETWFSLSSFLSYGASAWVVRAANTTSTNSQVQVLTAIGNTGPVSNMTAQVVLNNTDYLNKQNLFDPNALFVARYPGAIGNSLEVSVCYSATNFTSTINLASYGSSGANLSVNNNSNTGTIVINAVSVTAANSLAQNLVQLFSNTDLIVIGNVSIGTTYAQLSQAPVVVATGNTTNGVATISLQFQDTVTLHGSYSTSGTMTRFWQYYHLVGTPPGQSQWVLNNGNVAANDELHLVVTDNLGLFTGTPGAVLEVYKDLSRATDAFGIDGGSIYYPTVINQQSQYIWWANDNNEALSNTSQNIVSAAYPSILTLDFNGGQDGLNEGTLQLGDLFQAWDLFQNQEAVDITLVIAGKSQGGVIGEQVGNYLINNIAELRQDCVVFVSPASSTVVNNKGLELTSVSAFRNQMVSSSYGVLDTGYKYTYDKYNDLYRWVPLCGDVAGVTARTAFTNAPWWAPAGFNRGNINNVISLAYNPAKADRDVLYPLGVNPVVSFPGQGTVFFGNLTLLDLESAFNQLNIRMLFIVLEKAISLMAKGFLFEFNDAFTRAQFVNVVNPYLSLIEGQRGITDFVVRCDANNNTPQVIDSNQFIGDIFVKPNRAIAFIQLNFVAVGTALTFSEVEGAVP